MIFHIDLDAFFAAIEIRDNPALKGKPVLVGHTDPQGKWCQRGVVATCSYEARHYGVSSGMPLFKALKLCPGAIVVQGHFKKYNLASQKMYQLFAGYTPQIEPVGIDEAYLSFYGFEEFYNNNLIDVARRIKNDIKNQIGITASVGIAQNKVVAKIASGFQKPDGLTHIPKGREKEFLAPLPIGKLFGIGPALERKLKLLGIELVSDLQKQSPLYIKNLFGKYGELIWSWANGIDDREITQPASAKSVGRSITLSSNSEDIKYLKATLFYLCQKIAKELHEENLEGKCVTVTVRYANFSTISHQTNLSSPIASAWEIYYESSKLFDELWRGTPLRLVGIRISYFENQKQLSLNFDSKQKLPDMENSLEKIREKFGFWSIYPASLKQIAPSSN